MSGIKLVSQEYANNNCLPAKKNEDNSSYTVDDKVVFNGEVSTPAGDLATKADLDAKQDNLTAGNAITLNGNTISVDTATSVGTSDLPVTDRAVGNALINYVNDITSTDRSISITKDGSSVDLKANGAPTPESLGTTPLKHWRVYTLAISTDTDLSALTADEYATAELWIDYTAGSVTWPTGLWWVEGSAPTLEAGKSYAIAVRNDGRKLRANVQYEDDTPARS